MSYARIPQLGAGLEINLKVATSAIAKTAAAASTSKPATSPAAPLVFGMDPPTLAFAVKKCGPAPAPMGPGFSAWAACVMGGTGGAVKAAPAPGATLADVRAGRAVLKRGQSSGDSGQPILFWRQFLGLPAGIVFDAGLEDATKAFQRHMKLPETGQLDRATLSYALALPLKEGSDNDDVWALHRLLGLPSEGATGAYRYKFTQYTTKRLGAYQTAMMLPVTGVVDDATRSALLAQGVTPAMAAAAKEANATAKAAAAAKKPAAEEKPSGGGGSSSSASSGGSTGTLIMVGLVGLAAYFVWASPKVKRKRA